MQKVADAFILNAAARRYLKHAIASTQDFFPATF
jgi:hypothetical protein